MTTEKTPSENQPITIEDLQQLAEFANLVGAARDAMSDQIVSRIAGTMSESMILLDRITRNEGLMRLMQVLDKPETQNWLIAISEALPLATKEVATTAPAKGGIACLFRVATESGTHEGIRFAAALGKHISKSLREQHRRGVNPD
jgi:hypothetical protein